MRWLAIVPLVLYSLTATVVGVQLLRLAARTRSLPELTLGAGLTAISLVGMPASAIGRSAAWIGTPVGDGLFAVGVAIAHAGLALFFVFTWVVFRRPSPWARLAALAGAGALALSAAGLLRVGLGSTDMARVFVQTRPFAIATVTLVALAFLWNGLESARYARMLRRRLTLGLADPVVLDRFRLWAVVGFASAIQSGVLAATMAAGRPPLTEPLPLATIAVMSTCSGAGWYLSFLPPAAYLERVRRRAAGAA